MDETLGRILVILAIFLGCCVRTLAPMLRKKTLADFFKLELTWVGTAAGSFLASWIGIMMVIPPDLAFEIQIIVAFFAAFGVNSIANEAVKWKAVADYVKTGDKPQ